MSSPRFPAVGPGYSASNYNPQSTSSPYASTQRYTAPPPPPKPIDSRTGTPGSGPPLPPPPHSRGSQYVDQNSSASLQGQQLPPSSASSGSLQDPGEQWLPDNLKTKSKPDLYHALHSPEILQAYSTSASALPANQPTSSSILLPALQANQSLASHVLGLEEQLRTLRESTQAQLLQLHHLERSWRQAQSRMDEALAPFSAPALYQRLVQAIQEQEEYCRVLEESFLDGEGKAAEREVADWVKGFREGRKLVYKRTESKARWDEGRVGGWR